MFSSILQDALGVAGDHQFFMGQDHVGFDLGCRRAEAGASLGVGFGVHSTPSQASPRQTRSRISAVFSPMPPVKTRASIPPKAATSEPTSRWIQSAKYSMASWR